MDDNQNNTNGDQLVSFMDCDEIQLEDGETIKGITSDEKKENEYKPSFRTKTRN